MAAVTFQEFLSELAREQGGPDVRARRREWIDAVERLLGQIREWIGQIDPEGVLEIRRTVQDRAEVGLGRYEVPGLEIGVGDVRVEVNPITRNVKTRFLHEGLTSVLSDLGEYEAGGRVDIGGRHDRWYVFRILPVGKPEQWWAVRPSGYQDKMHVQPLDRVALERVLREGLS